MRIINDVRMVVMGWDLGYGIRMIAKIAEFTVKRGALDACFRAISEFVASVHAQEQNTLLYASFQKPDQRSFLHVMVFRDAAAEAHHRATPHVQKFVAALYPDCDREPVFTDVALVAPHTLPS